MPFLHHPQTIAPFFLTLRRLRRLLFMHTTDLKSRLWRWQRRFAGGNESLIIAAAAVGIVTGSLAHLLKLAVRWISGPVTSLVLHNGYSYVFVILPVVGVLLAVIYQKYILHQDIYDGTARRFKEKDSYFSPRLVIAPLIASSITLGFGGSAGSEGPIASSGAAVGSNIGRLFGLTPRGLMILTACGAGAGIAGIFKAPIGGALFIIEIFSISLSAAAIIALFVATTSSALTAFILSGCTRDIMFCDPSSITLSDIWIIALAGLFLGLYSTYYACVMRHVGRLLSQMPRRWIKAINSGVIIGLLVLMFPVLYGEGYGAVTSLLAGAPDALMRYSWLTSFVGNDGTVTLLIFAAAILIVKPFATASTVYGGGVAGDYAPLLMIGSVAGFLFATAANILTGTHLQVADFVFLGMTGVMAGAVKAPLMAIFLTVETVWLPSMFLPATVVAAVSYLTRFMLSRPADRSGRKTIHDHKDIYN